MFYCNRVVVEAPCKVNLSLDVTGVDSEGYHMLKSVMHAADLRDVLVVGRREGDEVRVTCSNPDAPENDMNIAWLAAKTFFKATGRAFQGLSVHIDKAIPIEAGLAGGSADAAAVLTALNRLFETGLSVSDLQKIGRKVGADVPFCLAGGCALAEGRGEMLTPLPPLTGCRLAVAKPPKGVSTRLAFQYYDEYGASCKRPDTGEMVDAIKQKDIKRVGGSMKNVFNALSNVEETALLSGIMLCSGALGSVLSGTGSAVIGLFDDDKAAKNCLRLLREQVSECWLASPVSAGAEIIHIS